MSATVCMKDLSEYSTFNEFRINEKLHDVIIRVKNRSFPCHRIILAASLKFFRSMFCGEYVEAEAKEVKLDWEDAEDFEQLVTYIYGGLVPVSEVNVYRLLKIAVYFGSKGLEDSSVNYILENTSLFSLDFIASAFRYASIIRNTILLDGLSKFIAENLVPLSEFENLYHISGNDLLKILSHSNLEEHTVYLDFLSKWVTFHPKEERKLLPELLNVIGLKEGPTREWILKTLLNNPSEPKNTEGLDNNEDVELSSESEKKVQLPFLLITHDIQACPKVGSNGKSSQVNAYKFWTGNEKTLRFVKPCLQNCSIFGQYFDFKLVSFNKVQLEIISHSGNGFQCSKLNVWRKARILKVYVSSPSKKDAILIKERATNYEPKLFPNQQDANIFTASLDGNNIYLYDNHEFIMYNCAVNNWFNVYSSGYENVFSPNLLSRDNNLYVIGGKYYGSTSPLACRYDGSLPYFSQTDGRLLQHLDIRQSKWSHLPPMKYVRTKAASCIYNDIIYVSGGDDLSYYNNHNVEWYDIKAGKWNEFSKSMPSAKMGHCLVANDDRLWFFGGSGDNYNEWFSYSLKEGNWSEISAFHTSYGQFNIQRIFDVVITD